jgi:hypothetical protein
MKKLINFKVSGLLLTSLLLLIMLTRIIPHPPNVTPIGAIALLGGIYFSNKMLSYIIPLIILFISDIFLGFYGSTMIFTYLGFISITFIGNLIKNNKSINTILIGTLLSALSFFIISNFGCWLTGSLYTKDLNGLINCFMAAIPFFRNSLLGNLFYVSLIITLFNLSYNYKIFPLLIKK